MLGEPPVVVATGNVPATGELVFRVVSNDGNANYRFQLDAPRVVVPEPGTALLLALGLATLGGRRRGAARPH